MNIELGYGVIQEPEPIWKVAFNKMKLFVRFVTCGKICKAPEAVLVFIDISDCTPDWAKNSGSFLTDEELAELEVIIKS